MHILHVLDHSLPLQSGYTFRSCAIFKAQRARGWRTDHLTGAKHSQHTGTKLFSTEEVVDGFKFYRTPESAAVWCRLPGLDQLSVIQGLTRQLDVLVARLKPTIIHAHSPSLNGAAAVRAARRHGVPVVYEVRAFWEDAAVDHGTMREGDLRYRLSRALENWVFRHAHAITTICEGLRSDLLARGLPPHKITVIPNSIDPTEFTSGQPPDLELLRKYDLNGKKVLGFIGSFYAYEGLSLLLNALPELLKAQPETRVVLVGGGPQEAELKRLVHELKIADKVIFTGRVGHDQVASYYELIDILVYPRLSMRLTETVTPLKPIEAMASRRLVVASDVGGHREIIQAGETGELFQAGSSVDLIKAILRMYAQRDRWPQIKQAARRYVESERSWPVSVARYIPVYEALAKTRSDAPEYKVSLRHRSDGQ